MTNSLVKKSLVKKLRKSKAGFTLIELIVVIAILGILAAILIPTVGGFISSAKTSTANADAHTVFTAAAAYVAANPTPTTPYTANALSYFVTSGHPNALLTPYLGSANTTYTITAISMDLTNTEVTGVTVSYNGVSGTYPAAS